MLRRHAAHRAVNCGVHSEPIAGLPGALRLRLQAHGDPRGFFLERWRADAAATLGIPPLTQLNHSRSSRGTLRGLHFQAPPHAQGKLVGVLRGAIFDVIVDLRRHTPSFGHARGFLLDDQNHEQLWVPAGFAHGFLVLSEVADVLYQVDAGYAPGSEGGLRWDDPALAIPWPLAPGETPLLSTKDQRWPDWQHFESPFP